LGDLSIDVKVILKWLVKKRDVRLWTRFIEPRIGFSAGSNNHGSEPLGSVNGRELLDQVSNY
jgi:hypothetical protein